MIGSSYVVIYDRQNMIEGGPLLFLSPGDTYHLPERSPHRNDGLPINAGSNVSGSQTKIPATRNAQNDTPAMSAE